MLIEERIHCGTVVSTRTTAEATYTESVYSPGSRLDCHAHRSPHQSILLEGAYFERMEDELYLRLPGDAVYYAEFLPHENHFGRLPARCLNIENALWSETPVSAPRILRQARALAESGELASLKPIADRVGLHPVYLARAFRRAFGQSVGDCIKAARVRRAASLIFRRDDSLGEIALEAGYYDQSHLTNDLARIAGFTPGELRRLADAS